MNHHNSPGSNTKLASESLTFATAKPLDETIVRYAPTDDGLRIALNALHDSGLSWREIAKISTFAQVKIRAGTLCSVAKGMDVPKKYRAGLGLPLTAPAPVCPTHGVVHCYDCQSQTVKAKQTRARGWRSLWDIPTGELRQMLENRQEYP